MSDIEHSILPLYQGRTNGCGTTALAMALNSLHTSSLTPLFTQAQLDRGYREPDMFSAPGLLLSIAKAHGFYGQIEPEICLNTVHGHLQQGHALLWLLSASGKIPDLHYLVLSGWKTDYETGDISIGFWDPAIRQTEIQWLTAARFQELSCQPITLWGIPLCIKPLLLAFSTQALPWKRVNKVSPLFTIAYRLNRLIYWGYYGLKRLSGKAAKESLVSMSLP